MSIHGKLLLVSDWLINCSLKFYSRIALPFAKEGQLLKRSNKRRKNACFKFLRLLRIISNMYTCCIRFYIITETKLLQRKIKTDALKSFVSFCDNGKEILSLS